MKLDVSSFVHHDEDHENNVQHRVMLAIGQFGITNTEIYNMALSTIRKYERVLREVNELQNNDIKKQIKSSPAFTRMLSVFVRAQMLINVVAESEHREHETYVFEAVRRARQSV